MPSSYSVDDALALMADYGPEFGGGLSNHGPMAAEALFAMGRGEQAIGWVEKYRTRLEPAPRATGRIGETRWEEALGRLERVADWSDFFRDQLDRAPWSEVLELWTGRFAPGISAAAFHGVLRTAHAVRSLAAAETPLRMRELAAGLAYWASTYSELPGTSRALEPRMPSVAIGSVPRLPLSQRRPGGFLTDGLAALEDFAPFASVLGMTDPSRNVGAFISNLTETFARVYVVNATDIGPMIAFIHCVTGPRAVRLLAPHLTPGTAAVAASYAWQAAAGLYTAFAQAEPAPGASEVGIDRENLVDQALANGDEHAIKFTEACLEEYSLNRCGIYLEAAQGAVRMLPPLKTHR